LRMVAPQPLPRSKQRKKQNEKRALIKAPSMVGMQ